MEEIKTLIPVYQSLRKFDLVRYRLAKGAFVILCIRGCLGWLGFDTIILTLFLNLFLVCSIDYTRVNRIFLIIPFLIISMLGNSTVLGIIDLITMCMILKKTSVTELANIYIYILLIFLFVWLFLLKFGFIVSNRWFDPAKGGESWDYGFENPNGLGIFGFHLCCTIFLLYKKKSLISIFLTIAISQIFYSMSLCRTAWIGGMVLALCGVFGYLKLYRSWMRYPLAIFPTVLFFCLCYLTKNINAFFELDLLFSGRIEIWHRIMSTMSLINWLIGTSSVEPMMDGSFMMLLFLGGLILVGLFLCLFYRTSIYYFFRIVPLIPFIIAILACGTMETTFSSCNGLSVIFWYILIFPNSLENTNKAWRG